MSTKEEGYVFVNLQDIQFSEAQSTKQICAIRILKVLVKHSTCKEMEYMKNIFKQYLFQKIQSVLPFWRVGDWSASIVALKADMTTFCVDIFSD